MINYSGSNTRIASMGIDYCKTVEMLTSILESADIRITLKQKLVSKAQRQLLAFYQELLNYDLQWVKQNKQSLIREIDCMQVLRLKARLSQCNDLENIKIGITAEKDWQFIAWKIAKYSAIAGAVGGITAGSGLVVAGTIFAPEVSIPLIVAGSVTVGVTAAASTTVGVVAHNRVS